MITAKELTDKYTTILLEDEEIRAKLEDAMDAFYDLVTKDNIYEMHLRYDIETAKKIAFLLKHFGYKVIEYKHGKLEVKLY